MSLFAYFQYYIYLRLHMWGRGQNKPENMHTYLRDIWMVPKASSQARGAHACT